MEPLQTFASVRVSLSLIINFRGNDRNAYMWNLSADGLSDATLLDALPHCKDIVSPSQSIDITSVHWNVISSY